MDCIRSWRTVGLVPLCPGIAGAAHAAPQIMGGGVGKRPVRLSAPALRQIEAMERDADARTPLQQKVASNLLYAVKMARGRVFWAQVCGMARRGVQ